MTTAFPEPFGVSLKGREIDGQFNPAYIRLAEGVNTIMVTSETGELLRIAYFSGGNWASLIGTKDLPASGVGSFTVGVGAGEDRRFSIMVRSGTSLSSMRASVTVINIPPKQA